MLNNFWLNPLFWLSFYLAGYVIAILMLALFGIEKVEKSIPRYLLRIFILLIFVLPPLIFPFTEGPQMGIPSIVALFMGAFFLGTSIIIRIVAQRQIGASPALKSKERLVTTGIYGFVRHPLYIGNWLFAMGLSLLTKSLYAFFFSILYAFLYLPIIYFEEKDLLKKYGEEYKKYKENVGLLFPKRRNTI